MRLLFTFAGMLVMVAAPLPLRATQAGAPATVMQDADPLSPLSPLDRTVTLALERVPLKAALDAVARQTGVRIAYSRRVVPLDRPVSVQLDAVRVEAALDTLLHGTGVAPTLDRSGQILLVSDGDGPAGVRTRPARSPVRSGTRAPGRRSRRSALPWSAPGSRAQPRPTAATPFPACPRGPTGCGRGCSATRRGTPRWWCRMATKPWWTSGCAAAPSSSTRSWRSAMPTFARVT